MSFMAAYNNNNKRLAGWAAILLCVLLPLPIQAASTAVQAEWYELNSNDERTLAIPLHKSRVLKFRNKIAQIAIGNAEIADAVLLNPRQLYILGQALGTTNIQVLGSKDQLLTTINLEVSHDLDTLQQNLSVLMPYENIQVHSSQKAIVLSGNISSPDQAQTAARLAKTFLPEPTGEAGEAGEQTGGQTKTGAAAVADDGVINMLKVGSSRQITLEIKVAEVSRQFLKRLNGNLNLAMLDGRFRVGSVTGGATLTSPSGTSNPFSIDQSFIGNMAASDKAIFGNYINNNLLIGAILNAAKENGQAKILAEPTLTTSSGQEAKFVSGGEFPTPVPQTDGNVAVEFKEFGVQVKFLPVITDANRINLKLDLSVSELGNANGMAIAQNNASSQVFVPSLTKRSVQTLVELPPGQTLSIAGLISDNTRSTVNKLPGLGDLPVIGAVFRSQEFIQGQTELVVFVTPYFSQPGAVADAALPTDSLKPPSDREFFLNGQIQAQQQPMPAPALAPVPAPSPAAVPAPVPQTVATPLPGASPAAAIDWVLDQPQ